MKPICVCHRNKSPSCGLRLFVTGGTGFFGCALLRWLSRFGATVPESMVVLSRDPDAFLARYPEFSRLPWLRVHQGNVLHTETWPVEENFSHILHAATDSTQGPDLAPLARFDQIAVGTRHALDFALRVGARRFLLTSSGAVYGPQPATMERIPETWNGGPESMQAEQAYGVGKRTAEHLCALYRQAYGLESVVARCFAFVGEDLPWNVHFAIGNFIRDALENPEIQVAGDGTPLRSYLYQDDLAEWLWALLLRGTPGRAYNLGSDRAISIADLAYLVRDVLAPDKPVQILGQAVVDGLRNRYIPDISRITSELGVAVRTSLDEAIRRSATAGSVAC